MKSTPQSSLQSSAQTFSFLFPIQTYSSPQIISFFDNHPTKTHQTFTNHSFILSPSRLHFLQNKATNHPVPSLPPLLWMGWGGNPHALSPSLHLSLKRERYPERQRGRSSSSASCVSPRSEELGLISLLSLLSSPLLLSPLGERKGKERILEQTRETNKLQDRTKTRVS